MANVRQKLVDAPARNDVYVGMLFFTVLAMALGVGLLAWEAQYDYDWKQPAGPKARQKFGPAAPKAAAPADSGAAVPPENPGGNPP